MKNDATLMGFCGKSDVFQNYNDFIKRCNVPAMERRCFYEIRKNARIPVLENERRSPYFSRDAYAFLRSTFYEYSQGGIQTAYFSGKNNGNVPVRNIYGSTGSFSEPGAPDRVRDHFTDDGFELSWLFGRQMSFVRYIFIEG